jgi:eukaryotic-like serine/threonine-protein kinase
MTVSYPVDAHPSGSEDAAEFISVGDIFGPYRLVKLLGEGSTGRVFEVEHLRIGRRAAMKIVHNDSAVTSAVRRMFAEAEAVNAIGNPHIVEITDVLVPAYGQPVHALVMELLEGKGLADLIANRKPLPMQRLLPIMAQVCDALSAVHAAGFVHRDLKPENVFLVERDSNADFVKLLDFGLVKPIHPRMQSPRFTVDGTFVGSPAYASPEQAAGKTVDWRTDIYSVGVMLYELVTGQLPFEAESIGDVLIKQITKPAPRLPDQLLSTELGQVLDDVIQTCLAKDPEQRGIPATQLADLFSKLASGTITGLVVSKRRRPPLRGLHFEKTIVPVVALVAVALIVGRHIGASQPLERPAPTNGVAAMAVPPPPVEPQVRAASRDSSHEPATLAAPKTGRTRPTPKTRRSASHSTPLPARVDAAPASAPSPENIDTSTTLDPYR